MAYIFIREVSNKLITKFEYYYINLQYSNFFDKYLSDFIKHYYILIRSTNTVTELVFETNESMKQFDAISNTIDMITEQTNLLALNIHLRLFTFIQLI